MASKDFQVFERSQLLCTNEHHVMDLWKRLRTPCPLGSAFTSQSPFLFPSSTFGMPLSPTHRLPKRNNLIKYSPLPPPPKQFWQNVGRRTVNTNSPFHLLYLWSFGMLRQIHSDTALHQLTEVTGTFLSEKNHTAARKVVLTLIHELQFTSGTWSAWTLIWESILQLCTYWCLSKGGGKEHAPTEKGRLECPF